MDATTSSIDLGFAVARVPPGTHVCHIYTEPEERDAALVNFLVSGLRAGEATACFSENMPEETLSKHLASNDISLANGLHSGALTFAPARNIYLQDGRFDPQRMLDLLARFHDDARAEGRPSARVIGEMMTDIGDIPGGNRLLEYEACVNQLLLDHPITAVCQYDARAFDGSTIMDVLTVHPMMLVRGAVILNPFFIPPEEFLRQ